MKYIKRNEIKTLSYEDYLILEGRKEDLEKKFIKEFGEGLGEVVFDLDPTENKAYADWLFTFFKNNKKELGINNTLNLSRKNMDKKKWRKEVEKLDMLSDMIKKYNNNKKNISKTITNIKTLDDFQKVLDKKDGFDTLEKYNEKEVIIYHNGLEWLVFQPFIYEVSELANRKDRKHNWCTTYEESHFINYLGPKGALLYCTNKLNSSEDIAFQLKINESITVWNSDDTDINELYSFYDMKEQFTEDTEIYDVLDEVEHRISFPEIDRKQLKQETINYYEDFDFEELGLDKDLYFELLDNTNFLDDFINNEIDYYHKEFSTDFLYSYDDELIYTFKFIWENCSSNFTDYFGLPKVGFWKDEGYPDLEDFKDALDNVPFNLEKTITHDDKDCYKLIEKYLDDNDCTGNLVETYFRKEKYDGYTSKDIFGEFFDDDIETLIRKSENYIDYYDYIKALVDRMSEEEMIEILYPD